MIQIKFQIKDEDPNVPDYSDAIILTDEEAEDLSIDHVQEMIDRHNAWKEIISTPVDEPTEELEE